MASPSAGRSLDVLCGVGGGFILAAVLIASAYGADDPADALVRNSIRLSLVWYALAVAMFLRFDRDDWSARSRLGCAARWSWTWACAAYLVHVGMAFEYVHRWSHAAAYDHVERGSGFVGGIFVSYMFTGLWTLDVAAWWIGTRWYVRRSPWIDRLLHALMGLVVFNGAVVFESGPTRWLGIAASAALATTAAGSRFFRGEAHRSNTFPRE